MKTSRSIFLPVRGLRYHIREWGEPGAPQIFMLHGWMDSSITFQFMVDAFKKDWHLLAPDWRGFGLSEWAKNGYWYPDYLADLDAILKRFSPDAPVRLLGHSLGGNVACHYAGVRTQYIRQLVSLEGYGMMRMAPEQAADRYAAWLDSLEQTQAPRRYDSQEALARRIHRNNPRLTEKQAAFIAANWSRQDTDGKWLILADPLHRRVNPIMTRMDEIEATWSRISAGSLMVHAEFSLLGMRMGDVEAGRAEICRRAEAIQDVRVEMIRDAGHMVQQDQPEVVAELIEAFLV